MPVNATGYVGMCKNRVKRKRKRVVCAVLILALIFALSACAKDAAEEEKSKDAEYVSAVLDCLYKGRTEELAAITAGSEKDAMALHDKAVAEQTSYLMYMFDLGECSAESAGAIREKVGQLYSLMKYEVAQDGEEVTVTYSPCLAMEELRRRLAEKLERYEGETENDYADLIAQTLGEVIAEGPPFGATARLGISPVDGKIDQETLGELDKRLLPY